MRKAWMVAKRDFVSYFSSPAAYIVLAVYMGLSGLFFYSIIHYFARSESLRIPYNAEIRNLISNMSLIFLFVSPMLTMKLLAEEKKVGTYELLLTAPLTVSDIVLGKFLAAAMMFGSMVFISFQFPAFLMTFGNPDVGPMLAGYLGFVLFGLACLAIGLFASSLTDSQIVATMVGFGLLLVLWVVGWMAEGVGGAAQQVLASLSLMGHLDNFLKGMVDLSDALYYLSVIAMFLLLTIRRLEWNRW